MSERVPVPPGAVSTIRGRWQAPALRWTTWTLLVLALAGLLLPGSAGHAVQATVVAVAIAVPLLRVAWLVFRWIQEHDLRFVLTGIALLAVIAAGALSAVF